MQKGTYQYRKDSKRGEIFHEITSAEEVAKTLRGNDTHRSKISILYRGHSDMDFMFDAVYPDDDQTNKFFITEILNDLHRNGFIKGGKAETMLHDWSAELRKKTKYPASRLKRTFINQVGVENW